jgi:2-dehydropantoate 2-reductase
MGMGSTGLFIAHTLKCLPNPPPVSLIFHLPEIYQAFQADNRTIRLINEHSRTNDERSGFDVDIASRDAGNAAVYWKHVSSGRDVHTSPPKPEEILPSGEIKIFSMILTVKTPATVKALRSLKHRIFAETTICLMQDGMGQVEDLNREVFTDPATRPTYMLAVLSHDVYIAGKARFVAIHKGICTTAVGVVRDLDRFPLSPETPSSDLSEGEKQRTCVTEKDLYAQITSRYLLRTLTRSPTLVCGIFPYVDLLQLQLEKLAVSCVLQPVTALLNVPNGSVHKTNSYLSRVSRLLIAEISAVIRRLPELAHAPGLSKRFSPSRIETLYQAAAGVDRQRSSPMREDLRNLKESEIDYINGYIVRRGQELGLKCVLNYVLLLLVKGKGLNALQTQTQILPYGLSDVVPTQDRPVDEEEAWKEDSIVLEDQGTPRRDEANHNERSATPVPRVNADNQSELV